MSTVESRGDAPFPSSPPLLVLPDSSENLTIFRRARSVTAHEKALTQTYKQ